MRFKYTKKNGIKFAYENKKIHKTLHIQNSNLFFFFLTFQFLIFFLFIFVFLFKNLINRGISRSKAAGILLNGKSLKDFFHRLNSFFQNFFFAVCILHSSSGMIWNFQSCILKGNIFFCSGKKGRQGWGLIFQKMSRSVAKSA